MKTIKNVLILIADGKADTQGDTVQADDVIIAERVRVSFNFDTRRPVGFAAVRRKGSKFFADLTVRNGLLAGGLFPAIGGDRNAQSKKVTIYEIGLCPAGNVDKRIRALK